MTWHYNMNSKLIKKKKGIHDLFMQPYCCLHTVWVKKSNQETTPENNNQKTLSWRAIKEKEWKATSGKHYQEIILIKNRTLLKGEQSAIVKMTTYVQNSTNLLQMPVIV